MVRLTVDRAQRLDSLTGLRFVAAVAVFGAHSAFLVSPGLADVLVHGRTGVSFFFVLSGFVLAWTYAPDQRPLAYYRRRFARVYPACAVTTLIVAVVAVIDGERVVRPLAAALLLVQSWVPEIDLYYGLNGVTWSLSVEAFFYLVFPLAVVRALRMPVSLRKPAMALLVVMVLVAALVLNGRTAVGSTGYWAVYIAPSTRLPEFLLGMLLAFEVRDGRWPRLDLTGAVLLAGAGYLAASLVPDSFSYAAVTLVPYTLLIGAAAMADLGGRRSPFRGPMVRLGVWSYAFYLCHQEIIRWYGRVVLGASTSDPIALGLGPMAAHAVVLGGICLLAAWALYAAVERPLERLLRPSAGGGHRAGAAEMAPPRAVG